MAVPLWKFDKLKAAQVNGGNEDRKPGQSSFGNPAAQMSANF